MFENESDLNREACRERILDQINECEETIKKLDGASRRQDDILAVTMLRMAVASAYGQLGLLYPEDAPDSEA
jgi:hypothetical protein